MKEMEKNVQLKWNTDDDDVLLNQSKSQLDSAEISENQRSYKNKFFKYDEYLIVYFRDKREKQKYLRLIQWRGALLTDKAACQQLELCYVFYIKYDDHNVYMIYYCFICVWNDEMEADLI